MPIALFSPAKVNLFFRVLKKRDDGYHEISSFFQTINFGDKLIIDLSDRDEFICSKPSLPWNKSNLVRKALDLFRNKTGLKFNVKLYLEKNIPIQAGLGGGSSNAATTLWALNALHQFPVDIQTLQSWSSEIGSDVPFFFSEGSALCTGRGEKVLSLPFWKPGDPLFLFKPRQGLSTPQIYHSLDLRTCHTHKPEDLLSSFKTSDPIFVNDLEKPAFEALPRLLTLKNKFQQNGYKTVMTGSGTALFLMGRGKPYPNLIPIKTVNRDEGDWYHC